MSVKHKSTAFGQTKAPFIVQFDFLHIKKMAVCWKWVPIYVKLSFLISPMKSNSMSLVIDTLWS